MQGALCMSAPCRGGGHHRAPGRIQSSGSCSGRLELHSPSASSRAAAPRVGACCSGASRNLTGQGRLNPNRLSGSGRRATYPRFSHASGGDVSPVPPTAPRPPRLDEEDSPTPPSVQVVGTYTEETDKTVSVQRTDRFTTGATSTGILKINQDLQLFRCRTLRHKAFYVLDKAERAAMMHQVIPLFHVRCPSPPPPHILLHVCLTCRRWAGRAAG